MFLSKSSRRLFRVTKEGSLQGVEQAIQHGADINAKDDTGRTALHWASRSGHLSIVRCLIQAGANVNIPDNNSHIPLHVASLYADLDIVQVLLGAGSNANHRSFKDWTPLHYAAYEGRKVVVQTLLDYGADYTLVTSDGLTAEYVAQLYAHREIAQLLHEHATIPNVKEPETD